VPSWGGWRERCCWGMLLLYAMARVCQLYADRLPTLAIVAMHVVPPAIFALVHGSVLYRVKGISVFVLCCLGMGTLAESVGLRTGFPFGRYYFTDVMGPKILQVDGAARSRVSGHRICRLETGAPHPWLYG
jgi:hypothetical protein